jgi:hypothetical protein
MFAHIILAVLIQAVFVRLGQRWIVGAGAASTWAISREITQAEYRWIERYGEGLRANMPWWAGLDLSVWNKLDPWLDWILPTAVVLAIAFIARRPKWKTEA